MPFTGGRDALFEQNEEQFDLNLAFEQLFLSILPSVLFIVLSSWRTVYKAQGFRTTDIALPRLSNLCTIVLYCALRLSLLVLAAAGSIEVTSMFLAAAALQFVSALSVLFLSLVGHAKSSRPSITLSAYLFISVLLNTTQARTLFLSSQTTEELIYSSTFTATLALELGIMLLEAQHKPRWAAECAERQSPDETSGIFSLAVFFWLNRLFRNGYEKILAITDLYPLHSRLEASALHAKFSRHLGCMGVRDDKHGLVKVLLRTLSVQLLVPGFPRLTLLGFTFCQPFLIGRLLDVLEMSQIDRNIGYGLIGASIFIYSGIAFSTAFCWYLQHQVRIMVRSILIAEIYEKATKLSTTTRDRNASLTLMSTDIERIDVGFRSLHEVWASIVQAAVASWLLYRQLGVAFAAPIGLVLLCVICLAILMWSTGDSQRDWMAQVQKRVSMTATIIERMKSLKLSGLHGPVSTFVQKLRVHELAAGSRYRRITIVAAFCGYIPLLIGPVLSIAFAGKTLDAKRTFTSLSLLLLLTNPLTQIFQLIPQIISGLACLERIQVFLAEEPHKDYRETTVNTEQSKQTVLSSSEVSLRTPLRLAHHIEIKDGYFGWVPDSFSLKDVNVKIIRSSLTVVVGAIGSGKSTFCKALLGEMPYHKGRVISSMELAHTGFCDQIAFIPNGTIKDIVIGFSPYDAERYGEVLDCVCLIPDLERLPQGDMTLVGSGAITLSGGQKQRLSLARALYLDTELLVFDDVLSGLDVDTEQCVFQRVFGPDGLLRRRRSTSVLCTHSTRHIPFADHIIALADGAVNEQGSFDDLMAKQGYVRSLRSWNHLGDKHRSHERTPPETHQAFNPREHEVGICQYSLNIEGVGSRQLHDRSVYKHYYKSLGMIPVVCSLTSAALWGFLSNFPSIWLTYWSDDESSTHTKHTRAYYVGIYAMLQSSALMSLLLLGIIVFIVSVRKAGANLHRVALETLIRAPLRFFTSTDPGIVTNLFSQDLNVVDTELPNALLNTLVCISQSLGQAAVMLSSSAYMAVSYPFLTLLLYLVQSFYLRTARQLRILDLEARSPLYTHFMDTAKGIATLRAFGFVSNEIRRNIDMINLVQRAGYLLLMIQQWLNLVLDLVVMAMAAILTTLAVKLHSSSGFTGASLVSLMGFGESLSGIVIFYTRLETSIGAIARLKSFSDTVKAEDQDGEDLVPPEEWPEQGRIECGGLSASYGIGGSNPSGSLELALRDINLSVESGEKVAICGRTGSGKSSLISLLLKLVDPLPGTTGHFVIDEIPVDRIQRSALRQRIIAVPQDDAFLSDDGTLRERLDPSTMSSDEDLMSVLATVGLWELVEGKGGLEAAISATSLSAGQQKLLVLSRALLRRRIRARHLHAKGVNVERGILLLDEMGSSLDERTESTMHEIIRVEFKDYTVISVIHRLETIMDYDKVVVMDCGRIVEVGKPDSLARTNGSRFVDLVKLSKS